jgi:hypothetical protein
MRFWTTIILVGICAFSVIRGLTIVHFSVSMLNIRSPQNQAESIGAWSAVPGIASAALQMQLKEQVDPSDLKATNARRERLSALVSIRPMSSIDWLSLSGLQLITDQPMDQVLGALMLSTLTGPNEGYVMTDRGIFGISVWEDLSPDLRRHVINDLAAGEIPESRKVRPVLDSKSPAVRNELRTAILAILPLKEAERRLGF